MRVRTHRYKDGVTAKVVTMLEQAKEDSKALEDLDEDTAMLLSVRGCAREGCGVAWVAVAVAVMLLGWGGISCVPPCVRDGVVHAASC